VVLAGVLYVRHLATDKPPAIDDLSVLKKERTQHQTGVLSFGNSWLRKSETGLWEAYIEGPPFERGVAFGKLTRELLQYQEKAFVDQIRELVPSPGYLKLLKYFTAFFNRNLGENIPLEYRKEIFGTSFACSPEFNFIGTPYQRQLNYHAAHDIGHALQGLRLVACTSFSAWKGATADSSLLVARNFDFYVGEQFAENKIICFVNPDEGYRFAMITWADMVGVVSGMNEKGLTVTLNAASSSIPLQAYTPVTILAREILQYAATIEEAMAISGRRRLFVSESLLIGSSRDGKSAIIEKSPYTSGLVYSGGDYLICTNHFQGQAFAADRKNLENIDKSDSHERYRRVNELIRQAGPLNEELAVSVMRNRKGLGDSDLGMGNPLSINQLLAHHSVVFLPDKRQFIVSAGPWQLGRYIRYDLGKVFASTGKPVFPTGEIYVDSAAVQPDSFLLNGGYNRYKLFLAMTRELTSAKKERNLIPMDFQVRYIDLNPKSYITYKNLAEYFEQIDQPAIAYEYYRLSSGKKLPGRGEEEELNDRLNKLTKKKQDADTRK